MAFVIDDCIRRKRITHVHFFERTEGDLHDQRCNAISTAVQDKEKKTTKHFAIEISRDYMTKKLTEKMQSHTVQKQKLPKSCCKKNCSKQTRKLCVQCDAYYCDTCYIAFHKSNP